MRVLKINKKDYVLKFTTKALMNLNAKGITLTSLASDMEKLNLISLYEAFCEGLKFANKEITLDQTYEIIDRLQPLLSNKFILIPLKYIHTYTCTHIHIHAKDYFSHYLQKYF